VFGQTLGHDFVNYDDDSYIHTQPEIVRGFSVEGVRWAFTNRHSGNWHPLTSISHMLDCQLYGLNPRGHHLTSVLLHGCTVIGLFFALRQMTGNAARAAFVAAVFAIHPLRAESVAWVAERKDVLSGLLFVLMIAAYTWYARRPSFGRYVVVAVAFALGLMSKPMLVTVPFVLLLLDFWPLRRESGLGRLVIEKLPLLLLSAAASAATILAQTATMSSIEKLPLALRLGNAAAAVSTYIWQLFWPSKLAVFYPHPRDQLPLVIIAGSVLLIVGVTIAVIAFRRTRPYLATGWFWFLGMLVPVIGIVQVGLQAHADRYTYLPHIGLLVALTWFVADAMGGWRAKVPLLSIAAAGVLSALTWQATAQVSHWRSSETLWRHAVAVTKDSPVAYNNLGNLLPAADAVPLYEKALGIDPESVMPMNNLAWILATCPDPSLRDGRKAVELATDAVRRSGDNEPVYLRTLAAAYGEAGDFQEAIRLAEHARLLAEAQGNAALAFDLQNNIAGFHRRIPVRDASLMPSTP
jgi:tetratricopeptide (TPR) repeat protein